MKGLVPRRRAVMMAGTVLLTLGLFVARSATAHAAGTDEETQFVLNTFAFLVWGALVMWMCAGFTMLESGSVRTKNASMICLKNIGLYAIAGLAYFFIGYSLMYVDVGSVIGAFDLLYGPSPDEVALLTGERDTTASVIGGGSATMSDWFFQMVFVATTASIVSGAIAERVKLWSFLLFTLVSDRHHLPGRRRLDVGWWLARRSGVSGLRRLHHCAQHRRLGGAGRRHRHRAQARQVPPRRQCPANAPI